MDYLDESFESLFNMSEGGIAFGSYLIAKGMARDWPEEVTQKKMNKALQDLGAMLQDREGKISEFTGSLSAENYSKFLTEFTPADKIILALNLAYTHPFYPFDFMPESCSKQHLEQLSKIMSAKRSPLVDKASVESLLNIKSKVEKSINSEITKGELKNPKSLAKIVSKASVGAVTLGGLAIFAGPSLAVLLPAASGLSGAAAVSAGMASLGGGAVASGGMGMAGGMWILGAIGGTVGAATGASGQLIMNQVAIESLGSLGISQVLVSLQKLMICELLIRQDKLNIGEVRVDRDVKFAKGEQNINIDLILSNLIATADQRVKHHESMNSSKAEKVVLQKSLIRSLKVYQKAWKSLSV